MKRITIAMMALMSLTTAQAQEEKQDTAVFMNGCREFVNYVEGQAPLTKLTADSLIIYQDSIKERYRQIKPQLNDDQVGEYNRLIFSNLSAVVKTNHLSFSVLEIYS